MNDKRIGKSVKLACNPYAQPDVRMREMQRLLNDGSEAALRGVLKRFGANASGQIADEDEKKYLEDAIVDLGEEALEPLRGYIRSDQQITYALHAYRRIAGAEEAVRFFIEALDGHGPEDHRTTDAKLQLIWTLAEDLDDARVLLALLPYLLDHSDDVRWAVMDIVERAADDGRLSGEPFDAACRSLGELLLSEATSTRMQQRAAAVLCAREWRVPTDAETLPGTLEDQYFLDKKQYVRRRVKK